MPLLIIFLLCLLAGLQYTLWWGTNSYTEQRMLQKMVAKQQAENVVLRQRNATLLAEVTDLQQGLDAVEERARYELGMVQRGEVFYQIITTDE